MHFGLNERLCYTIFQVVSNNNYFNVVKASFVTKPNIKALNANHILVGEGIQEGEVGKSVVLQASFVGPVLMLQHLEYRRT